MKAALLKFNQPHRIVRNRAKNDPIQHRTVPPITVVRCKHDFIASIPLHKFERPRANRIVRKRITPFLNGCWTDNRERRYGNRIDKRRINRFKPDLDSKFINGGNSIHEFCQASGYPIDITPPHLMERVCFIVLSVQRKKNRLGVERRAVMEGNTLPKVKSPRQTVF